MLDSPGQGGYNGGVPRENTMTMTRVEGTPAVWPVTHTFDNLESNTQESIVAETPASARQLFAACGITNLMYVQSQDAEGRFVYDLD